MAREAERFMEPSGSHVSTLPKSSGRREHDTDTDTDTAQLDKAQ